ncbi:MAG: hypothetical protein M1829_006829 [Trizodia sp. TS-e1964]|nr:MAG: hypothetical protein M1829_006829 [Trizodia sp. TS-e1964]
MAAYNNNQYAQYNRNFAQNGDPGLIPYQQPPTMSQGQQAYPQVGATFYPGGVDDFYMPEVISPLPQRHMPEVPEQIQENLAHLELEASTPASRPGSGIQGAELPANPAQGASHFPNRLSSLASPPLAQQAPGHQNSPLPPQEQQAPHQHYKGMAPPAQQYADNIVSETYDILDHPSFSPFPKLVDPPANVPPSDDDKEATLEQARVEVLHSNDPEMQLAWAQDSLAFVEVAMQHESRISEHNAPRPQTPQVEHQLRVDSIEVVSFLAEQHHPKAEFMKGMWLEFGKFGFRVDKKEAFRCYTRAAEKGYARAEYRIGMQYETSNDPQKAIQHYEHGVELGDSASNYRLGMMTLLGQHGKRQDFAKGIAFIQYAAQTADENAPQGAYVLGMLQARELPNINVPEQFLPYDIRAARVNIEKAAYLGFARAQLKMGGAYELCQLGCEFNPALSLHYNALAARQGEPEADMAISKWFLCGFEGVFEKNEELAFTYAQRAAQSGLATAEFAMGYFFEIGIYVGVDLKEARTWYEKASDHGNTDAISRIKGISEAQTLSKKDHENVAIARIKSQYGSQRGKRPERFKASPAAMPTITDEPVNMPDPAARNSIAGVIDSYGHPQQIPRPATVAPYPLEDGPPQFNANPNLAHVNTNSRPNSAFNPNIRPSSAFGINPNIRTPSIPGPGNAYPSGPARPHTSMGNSTGGRGRGGPRVSPGTPAPSDYRAPVGHESYPPQAIDIGFVAPLAPITEKKNKLQKQLPHSKTPVPNLGYQAPLEQRNPSQSHPPSQTRPQNHEGPRPPTVRPVQGPGPNYGPRPVRNNSIPVQAPGEGINSGRPPQVQNSNAFQRPPRSSSAAKSSARPPIRSNQAVAASAPAAPGKGPKTFEDMGIPQAKKEDECDPEDSATPEELAEMDKDIEALKKEITAGKAEQKALQSTLTVLKATPATEELREAIQRLELERKELNDRLAPLRSGALSPVTTEERDTVEKAWRVAQKLASARKKIFQECWATLTEELPEGTTKADLWVRGYFRFYQSDTMVWPRVQG